MRKELLVFTSALGVAIQATTAQTAPNTPPPCTDELYAQFDFWVGEWDVYATNQKGERVKAGENSIQKEEGGCLLVERWTSANGTGQSYNFVDPLNDNKWRQVWVSGFGAIDYVGGLNDDGAMVLEGEIAYRTGVKAPFKGIWTLNDDGTVTQHFKQYDAEKEVWNDWFIGTYVRKENSDG